MTDCVLYRKRYLSADERTKERKKSQMQAASRGQHRPQFADFTERLGFAIGSQV